MDRHDETKNALLAILQGLGTEPIDMYRIGVPMIAKRFTQDEIYNVLMGLQLEQTIEFLQDNTLRVLKEL